MARSPKRARHNGSTPPRLRLGDDSARRLSKAQQNMAKLWREGSLCDVEIVVEDRTFRAHRNILAAGSDYMSALFCEDRFRDSTEESIKLEEMAASSFKIILEFLYEGQCDLEESEVMDLLETASRLQCVDIVPKLEVAIADRLAADTCLGVWDAAERMQLTELAEAAEAKSLESYEELISTDEFKALPAPKLVRLLASDKLRMKDEEAVFISVVSWAKAQATPPSDDMLGEIFDNVRFSLMSEPFINDCVMSEKLVVDNPRALKALCYSMKDKAYNKSTARTSLRCIGRKLTWEDMTPGLRVRIMDDVEAVKLLCQSPAPGAGIQVNWIDSMEPLIGAEGTVAMLAPNMCAVTIAGNYHNPHWWPFVALELA